MKFIRMLHVKYVSIGFATYDGLSYGKNIKNPYYSVMNSRMLHTLIIIK